VEPEHPVALHRRPHLRRHGPEILARDGAAIAMRLDRQDREELVARVADVDAVRRGPALGHAVQAEQSHHVIDAQHPRDLHVVADAADEVAIAIATQRDRRQRGQAPVLAAEEQRIGWRARRQRRHEQPAMPPNFIRIAVHADRQIDIELHVVPGERLELLLHRPLRHHVRVDVRALRAERDRIRAGHDRRR
jgi:hypothetical protein